MAEQPKNSDNFSDYVDVYFKQLTGSTGQKKTEPTPFPYIPGQKQELGFLARTADILSRPMRIVSNPVMKAVELPERFDVVKELRAAGDDAAATKESLNAVGSLLAAPFTGFFSDDPSNKPYWSDIIEKSVDVENRNDASYVDTANNADPVLKGTLGFIGDVLIDPLWLVPGGWAAKGAKEAARAAKAAEEAAKAARGISTTRPVGRPGVSAVGPEGAVDVIPLGGAKINLQNIAAPKTTFDLTTTVGGKTKTQNFATRADAEKALSRLRSGKRPLIESTKGMPTFRGSNYYSITPKLQRADVFPSAQASQKIADDLAETAVKGGTTSSETVVKSLREIIDSKMVSVGGKTAPLKGELNSFFKTLAKAIPATAPKTAQKGKPRTFDGWLPAVEKDSALSKAKLAVPGDPMFANVFGNTTTIGYVTNLYRNTKDQKFRDAIEAKILRPAFERYTAGVKAGKDVDFIGNAATPTALMREAAEASVAATIVRNLKNLDDAERARGAALLGADLFADLQKFDPQGMAKFLDDIDFILKDTGAIDALGVVGSQTLAGRVLSLFDSEPVLRAAAEAQLARNIDSIPAVTPENLMQNVERVGRSADMSDFVAETIRRLGITGDPARRIEAIQEAMSKVLPDIIRAKLDPKYRKRVYKYRQGEAAKTAAEFGAGKAVIANKPNTGFQAEIAKDFEITMAPYYREGADGKAFLGNPDGSTFKGDKFIREKERDFLIGMSMAEELIKRNGLALTMDLNGVSYNLGLSQAYEIVSQIMGGLPSGNRALAGASFNAFSPIKGSKKLFDGTLPHGVFADAVAKALSGGSVDDVLEVLLSKVSDTGVNIVNGFSDAVRANRTVKMGPTGMPAPRMARDIAAGIIASLPKLADEVAKNTAIYAERGLVEGKQLLAEAAEIIVDTLRSPEATASQIRMLANPDKIVDDLAGVVPTTELGQAIAKGALASGVGPEASKTAKLVEDLSDAAMSTDPKKIVDARGALADNAAEAYQRMMDETMQVLQRSRDELLDDVADEVVLGAYRATDNAATQGRGTVTAMTMKLLDPVRRFFDAKAGMHTKELLWGSRLFFAQGSLMALVNKPFLKSLKTLMQNNDYAAPVIAGGRETVLQRAFSNVQNGVRSAEGSVLRKAEDDIRPMMARFFDQTNELQNVLLGNAFFRTGAGRESINSVLDYAAVLGKNKDGTAKTPPRGIFFDEDLAVKTANDAAKAAGKDAATQDEIMQALLNQWKTWEVPDPIGFMYDLNRAMVQLASEVSYVSAFRQKALSLNLASEVPKKGFVKIVVGEDSRYGKFLGDKPLYMDPDVAEMFDAIDNFAKTSKQFEGGFGKFVRTAIDPVTNTWKYAITLPRPGHHIRNMVGDLTLTYLAEGGFGALAAANKAWQMMAFRGTYSDVDVVKAMTRNGITEIPKDATVMSSGQFGSLTANELYQELFLKRGIIIPARQREGLMNRQKMSEQSGVFDDDVVSNAASETLEKVFAVTSFGIAARGGKMEDFITGVAEGRDTFVRMQHALQMLEKAQRGKVLTRGYGLTADPKKLSKDELFDIIAERVGKYHPDMSTLAAGEKKYLRRVMPFYHWNRGAIQAVSETLLMNPGRVVAFNKATYNIAVAAGINPDSLYDPFPDDQLFPSFLRDQMEGPLFEADGRYFGVRPGIVTFDVMNQFASANPIDTVLDNANPFFKIPIELLTGTRLGTQSRIRDYSDYLDSSLPGFNYAANVSGQSITGSFYSLLTRGAMDPQYQFEVGNKDSRDQIISAVNWLTGIGLTDYSRPNYIRFAEQEQQQERREEPGF